MSSLLSVPEVAKALGVSEVTVRRIKSSGKLASIKVGGQVRFYPKDVVSYLDRNRHW